MNILVTGRSVDVQSVCGGTKVFLEGVWNSRERLEGWRETGDSIAVEKILEELEIN